jgi:hypothetical protein
VELLALVFNCLGLSLHAAAAPSLQVNRSVPLALDLKDRLKERGIPISRIWLRFTPPTRGAAVIAAAALGGDGEAGEAVGSAAAADVIPATPSTNTNGSQEQGAVATLGVSGGGGRGGGDEAEDGIGGYEGEGEGEGGGDDGEDVGGEHGWPDFRSSAGGWCVELLTMLLDSESMERLWSNTLVGGNALRLCTTVGYQIKNVQG